jgi:hypothetical protein
MLTRTNFPDISEPLTVSQHHLKAANHLDAAARSHVEAARLIESGEQKAAELQLEIARSNVFRAGMQVIEAGKKRASSGVPETR